MKEHIELTKFTCDNCKKESGLQEKFPYSKKWIYLFMFQINTSKDQKTPIRDRHFCSSKCLKENLIKIIDEKPKNDKKNMQKMSPRH